MLALALGLGQIPGVSHFLSWQTTFFHEISHGLAALISGGGVEKIELHLSGSGLCETIGGLEWFILAAGYAGATFWGLAIFLLAEGAPEARRFPALFILGVLGAALIFWATDFISRGLIILMAACYWAALKMGRYGAPFLKIMGLYIMFEALKAPLALFHHQPLNDAAQLAARTPIPGWGWIFIWLAVALGGFLFLWRRSTKKRIPPEDSAKSVSSNDE